MLCGSQGQNGYDWALKTKYPDIFWAGQFFCFSLAFNSFSVIILGVEKTISLSREETQTVLAALCVAAVQENYAQQADIYRAVADKISAQVTPSFEPSPLLSSEVELQNEDRALSRWDNEDDFEDYNQNEANDYRDE